MLLDYKSGSTAGATRVKDLEKLSKFQMSIYRLLLRERYPDLRLAFVRLFESPSYQELPGPEEKEEWLMKRLEELRATRSFEAAKCEDLQRCRHCPYRLLCERGEYL